MGISATLLEVVMRFGRLEFESGAKCTIPLSDGTTFDIKIVSASQRFHKGYDLFRCRYFTAAFTVP